MTAATSLLNAAGLPFQLKVLRDPDAYHRADAGVLYLRPRHCEAAVDVVGRIHARVASRLRPDVPLFTLRLADGLGFAEGSMPSLSFGQERCRLVAEALADSFDRGERERDARAATLAGACRRRGLDPLRPHLRPGGRDIADLGARFAGAWAVGRPGTTARTELSPIEAAERIGLDLCHAAYWDGGGRLCNWMGRSTTALTDPGGPIAPRSAALAPDLYGGSAGIALFLAQLHTLAGGHAFRRTALAAITGAIERIDRPSPRRSASPLSFFTGTLGAAYAARRIAALIEHPELLGRAGTVLLGAIESAPAVAMLDVIEGHAGAIPALLDIGREPGWTHARERAISLGEELCLAEGRRRHEEDVPLDPGHDPFGSSGLAHGASGIGLALLELHAVTGRLDFRDAARRAFDGEDLLFDERKGNWAGQAESRDIPRFHVAWCDGAPGLHWRGCGRRCSIRVAGANTSPGLAPGIRTTLDTMERGLASPRCDASLCHGLAGLIEILGIAGRVLDDAALRTRTADGARALIDRHAESGDWPSGVYTGGPNPSLMLGTAGIGYAFLRLHDPDRVPSILWVGS